MRGKTLSIGLMAILAIFTATLLVTSTWAATHEQVLYSFNNNGMDGAQPVAGLIFDAAGNLYGTTYGGGTYDLGTVFELTPTTGGGWTEKVLSSPGWEGWAPSAGLIMDAAGNLYGTTAQGGDGGGCGNVFELTPTGEGWAWKDLHSFSYDGNRCYPGAGLIFDAAGNLYGTTSGTMGRSGCATVFELTPAADGGWTEHVLSDFWPTFPSPCVPTASLIFDAAGNLYGTTMCGGAYGGHGGYGTVFELTRDPRNPPSWTEGRVLHSFNLSNTDGPNPRAGLMMDAAGNLYGTTSGYDGGYGTVFELARGPRNASWTYKVLHIFNGTEGAAPYGGVISDAAGNLYGTTRQGGTYGAGTVFEITP